MDRPADLLRGVAVPRPHRGALDAKAKAGQSGAAAKLKEVAGQVDSLEESVSALDAEEAAFGRAPPITSLAACHARAEVKMPVRPSA